MKWCLYAVLLGLAACANAATMHAWPRIMSFQKNVYFEDANKASVDIPINGVDGNTLYELRCHNSLFEGDPEFDYSGLIAG